MKLHVPSEGTVDTFIKKLLIAYVILQPVFDLYMSLFDDSVQIAGVSLATIGRFGMVFVMTLLVMWRTRRTKLTWCLVGYAVLVLVYAFFHHRNAIGFTVELAHARYSPVAELLFIARLCLPPALLYVVYYVKPRYEDIRKMLLWVSIIMSTVIILGNLFKFGYVAYNIDKVVIEENMIDWFRGTDTGWEYLTCRGLFQGTNQISAAMLIMLPFLTYLCFREKKIRFWVVLVLHLLAMQNLGTRIAAIAGLLGFAALIVVYFLEKLLYKQPFRGDKKTYLCMIVAVVLILTVFLHSPSKKRIDEDGLTHGASVTYTEEERRNDKTPRAERLKFIEQVLPSTPVNPDYILHVYPYQVDVDFWYDLLKYVPEWARVGNRNQREFLMDRILELDNRPSNTVWGISHTRASSFIWPERDIVCHMESMGIAGILLFFSPYVLCILVGAWHLLKNLRDRFHLCHYVYLCSAAVGIVAGYLSGYVLDELFPFTFLCLMAGVAVANALAENRKETDQ